jgi:hypothetical protein
MENCPLMTEKELKKLGRGAMDFKSSDDGILIVKWFDNKEVVVASNHYSALPVSQVCKINYLFVFIQ